VKGGNHVELHLGGGSFYRALRSFASESWREFFGLGARPM